MLSLFLTEGKASNEILDFAQKNTMQTEATSLDEIVYAKESIRRYLETRPNSADTLEGIHQWWINWPSYPPRIEVTLVALEQLQLEGFVESIKIGNQLIWRKVQDVNVSSSLIASESQEPISI